MDGGDETTKNEEMDLTYASWKQCVYGITYRSTNGADLVDPSTRENGRYCSWDLYEYQVN